MIKNQNIQEMEKFIEKIGLDRIAHFGIGGVLFAAFNIAFLLSLCAGPVPEPTWRDIFIAPIGGYFVAAFAAFIKEYFLDSRWDWWDIIATMAGPVFIHLCAVIGFALHFGNDRDLIATPLGWAIFSVIAAALAGLFVWWVIRFNKRK